MNRPISPYLITPSRIGQGFSNTLYRGCHKSPTVMHRVNSSLKTATKHESVDITSATRHVSTESELTYDVWRVKQAALSAVGNLCSRCGAPTLGPAVRTMEPGRFGCDAYGAATSAAVHGVGAHFISISFQASSHRPSAPFSYNYSTKGSRECTCRTIPYANVITKLVRHYYIRSYV